MDNSGEYSQEEFEDDTQQLRYSSQGRKTNAQNPEDYSEDADEYEDIESSEDEDESAGMGEQEQIEKLRLANDVLRKQLKDFGRVFEASMNSKPGAGLAYKASSGGSSDNGKRSLRAIIQSKQKQVQGMQKKLDAYKKNNQQLKRQMKEAFTTDRVLLLTNEVEEKQRQIDQLVEDNRSLQTLQRTHAKRIAKQQESRGNWSTKLTNLQEELRVARETLRKYREKSRFAEEESNRHREHIMKLTDRNKELKSEIKRYESANGKAKTRETLDAEEQQSRWDEERRKLEHAIQVLEKSNKQERIKAHQATKQLEVKAREHESAIEKMQTELDLREKDMRFQLVQIKKLKKGLRELALGDTPLNIGDTPWSSNMHHFLNSSVNFDDDEGNDKQSPAVSPHQRSSPKHSVQSPTISNSGREPASPSTSPKPRPGPPEGRSPPIERGPRVARTSASAASAIPSTTQDSSEYDVKKSEDMTQEEENGSTEAGETTENVNANDAEVVDDYHEEPIIARNKTTESINEQHNNRERIEDEVDQTLEDEDYTEGDNIEDNDSSASRTNSGTASDISSSQPKSAFAKPMMKSKKKKKKF